MPIQFVCACGRCGRMRLKIPRVTRRDHEKFEAFTKEFMARSRITVTKGKKKRKVEKNQQSYQPTFRGSRQKLILPQSQNPCELCGLAEYNRTCGVDDICLSYNYYMTNKIVFNSFGI